MEMNQKATHYLEKSGFTNSRNIDIAIYEDALKSEGYQLNELVRKFLKQFGGLEITIPAFRRPEAIDKIFINPIKAISVIYRGNVIDYEERVGESMVIIGITFNEELVLLMSKSGKIYAAFDDYLTLLGDNIFDAIENMSESRVTPEV
jgi:hypothetical protein